MSVEREGVQEMMVWCLDHAESAAEVGGARWWGWEGVGGAGEVGGVGWEDEGVGRWVGVGGEMGGGEVGGGEAEMYKLVCKIGSQCDAWSCDVSCC